MPTQLTWGALRKIAEGMPDEAPVYIQDGNFDYLPAMAGEVCTHKEAGTLQPSLVPPELTDCLEFQVEELSIPALAIGFDGAFDFENPPLASIA